MCMHPVQWLRHSSFSALVCCVAFLIWPAGAAFAVCVSGAQCRVDDGSMAAPGSDSFQSVGAGVGNAALVAINPGSVIQGAGLNITGSGTNPYGVYAGNGGTITLNNYSIIAGGNGVYVQGVQGAGSTFSMTGGSITSSGQAVHLRNYGSAALTDVAIVKTGSSPRGAVELSSVGSNNSFQMTGGSIVSASGALHILGNNHEATLSNVAITNTGNVYAVWFAGYAQDSKLTLNGGTTIHHNPSAGSQIAAVQLGRGATVIDDAHIFAARGQGIAVMGSANGLARLDARNFSIQTSGNGDYGMQIDSNSSVKLAHGSITTLGTNARGIWLTGNNQPDPMTAQDLSITTSGAQAHALYLSNGVANLADNHFETSGFNAHGVVSDSINSGYHTIVQMNGGSIRTHGDFAYGVYAAAGGEAYLDGVTITSDQTNQINAIGVAVSQGNAIAAFKNGTIQTYGHGVAALTNALVDVENSQVTSFGAARYGLTVQTQAAATVKNSAITVTGAGSVGLGFRGLTTTNLIQMDDSVVTAMGAGADAVRAFGATNRLDANHSTLIGDRLVAARNADDGFGNLYGAKLDINADHSALTGHAAVEPLSTLTMNLANDTDWRLRPSAGGMAASELTFLNLDRSRIVFAAPDPVNPVYQTLTVGRGERGGRTDVYHAFDNARIEMNTWLNTGGALANQFTDRLLINGDVSGTTLLTVHPVTGSPGGATSPSGANLANEGISLVQVAGKASADAFALAGGYVALGGQPWRYGLHAYGPGSTAGAADDTQRLVDGTDPHWDWRLQSESLTSQQPPDAFAPENPAIPGAPVISSPRAIPNTPVIPKPVPQVANYLTAPGALFQAGLLDIGMLHRRVGDAGYDSAGLAGQEHGDHDAFLRTYGGDYNYRSGRSVQEYGYGAKVRSSAAQIGGNLLTTRSARDGLRLGMAASVGDVKLTPQEEPDTLETDMHAWSVYGTLNWQNAANGAYVDAVLAVGKFDGDVHTRLRGKTASLEGERESASLEVGLPFETGAFTFVPQAQATYQRLHFARTHDVDGFDVDLGDPGQVEVKAGGEVRVMRLTATGNVLRLYGKGYVKQAMDRGRHVWLGSDFARGDSGAALEAGLGMDVVLNKGKTTVYVDVTRQNRLGHVGQEGWSANLGVRGAF